MALNTDYVLRETGHNLRRNLGLTIASVITVMVALVLVGVAFLMRTGVDRATGQWQNGIELRIYLEPDATDAQVKAVKTSLDNNPEVKRSDFVDHEAALKEFRELFDQSPALKNSVTDPKVLPASFKVAPLNPDAQSIEALDAQYRDDAGVFEVVSASDTIRQMQRLLGRLSIMCVFVAGGAGAAAIILVFNTIRMAMFARRTEIEVMKLVGASNWFIRVPFMLEGLIQGLLGSLAAAGSLFLFNTLLGRELVRDGVRLLADFAVPNADLTGFTIAMVVVGAVGSVVFSAIAASLYLDV